MFISRIKKVRQNRNGRIVWKKQKLNRKKDPEMDTTTQTKGCVNPNFKKKYKLLSKSLPHKIANIFLPLNRNK